MSEHGFHVHGPHDHELEHAAHGAHGILGGRLAVITAILATIGSIFSYMSGTTEVEAMQLGNESAIRRNDADNRWGNELTAANQLHMAELAIELVPDARKGHFNELAQRMRVERENYRAEAERLDAEAVILDERSDRLLHYHHRWSQATTVLQIAIALAAIALLTRRGWLVWGVCALGGIGAFMGTLAWLHI